MMGADKMGNFFSLLRHFLELNAVAGPLGVLDAGLNIAALFRNTKAKFEKDSIEYEIICTLEDSLKKACEELGWEYDALAVSQEVDITTLPTDQLMTKAELGKLYAILVGRELREAELSVFVESFDKTVAANSKLHRYLDMKWKRNVTEDSVSAIDHPGVYDQNQLATKDDIESLRIKLLSELHEANTHNNGNLRIIRNSELTVDYWKDLLLEAREKSNNCLILTGTTFKRWINTAIRRDFITTLLKLIKNRGHIKLIICKDNSVLPGEVVDLELAELRSTLIEFVFPVLKRKYPQYNDAINTFSIYEIDDAPYHLLYNGKKVIVSQRFQYTEYSNALIQEIDGCSRLASQYTSNLYALLKNKGSLNEWLKEYYS